MQDTGIQIVSHEAGEPTAVLIPIRLCREIASERETTYLLGSDAMRKRLVEAAQRRNGMAFEAVIEKLGI